MTLAVNRAVVSANPAEGKPARMVKFHADRDMNKALDNLIVKSI